MTGRTVLAGGLWNTLSLLAPQAFTLVVSVVAARVLGPNDMGRQSFISFAQISLYAVLSSGMQQVLLRFVGERLGRGRPEDVGHLLRWSWRVSAASAAVGGVVLIAVALSRTELRTAWFLAALACAASVLHAVPSSLLQGLHRWRAASTIALVTGAGGMSATVVVLLAGGGITGIFVVQAGSAIVSLIWAQVLARTSVPSTTDLGAGGGQDTALGGQVARYAVVSTLQAFLFVVVWRRSEFLFLEHYSTPDEIAMYSVAFAASSALVLVPQGLTAVFTPALAQLFGAGASARIRSGFDRSLRLLILLSLPLSASAVSVGPAVLEVVYGEDYRRAGAAFVALVAVLPMVPLYFLATSLLQAVGRERTALAVSAAASVVNVVCCFLLVPAGGALGAAMANVAAQVVAAALVITVASRCLGGSGWRGWRLLRVAAASVGAAVGGATGVAHFGGPGGVVAGVTGSAALFAVTAWWLRILSPADAEWLDIHAGHRAGGLVRRICRPFLTVQSEGPHVRKKGHQAQLATVDVFDTVLTRAVGRPEALFLLVGRLGDRPLGQLSPEAFARVRRQAEHRARDRNGEGTTLAHIVREMGFSFGLTPDEEVALADAELELEVRLIRPVPEAAAWLADLRRAGGRVAFVSDTYLPSAFVRDQLIHHGCWSAGDSLYVSCEFAAEKRKGRLFDVIAREERVNRREIRHHGNDPEADVRAPRRAGLSVAPVTAANLNRYEELLEDSSFASGGLTSLLAGASRQARLEVVAANATDAALRDVAAGVCAPVLVAYVLSLLRDATRSGLERLYFVSRDGEILLELARRLADSVGYAGDLRYLYGSRQAWNLAGLEEVSERHLEWILDEGSPASVRTVLARVSVVPEEVAVALGDAGFVPDRWCRTLSSVERSRLAGVVVEEPVAGLIVSRAESKRAVLVRYLRQEGLLDAVSLGVVDLGWYGRAGAALSSVLRRAGASVPDTYYYFGLHRQPPPQLGARCRPYLFDGGSNVGGDITGMPGVINLLESFCAGTHGLVSGYHDDGSRVVPVLKSPVNDAALAWGLPTVRTTIDRFVDALVLDRPLADLDGDLQPAVTALLDAFVVDPTRVEAQAWGAIEFSGDQNEASPRRLAYPYSAAEVIRGYFARSGDPFVGGRWVFGSLRLSSPWVRFLMGPLSRLLRRIRSTARSVGRRRAR